MAVTIVGTYKWGHSASVTAGNQTPTPIGTLTSKNSSPWNLVAPTTGLQADDRLLMIVGVRSAGMKFTAPAGWANFSPTTTGNAKQFAQDITTLSTLDAYAFTRTVPSDGVLPDIALPYTASGSTLAEAVLIVIRGAHPTAWFGTAYGDFASSGTASPRTDLAIPGTAGNTILRLHATASAAHTIGNTYSLAFGDTGLTVDSVNVGDNTSSGAPNIIAVSHEVVATGQTQIPSTTVTLSNQSGVTSDGGYRNWGIEMIPAPTTATATQAAVASASHTPAHTGDTLNVQSGAETVWSVPSGAAIDSYERTAQRSTNGGGTWADIAGSTVTASTEAGLAVYTIQTADKTNLVRYRTRAHNSGGWSADSFSNSLSVYDPPVNTVAPAITVGGVVPTSYHSGDTLHSDAGTWTNEPATKSYQWLRGAGVPSTIISGATAADYVVATADEGTNLRCQVTAVSDNGAGSTIAYSNTVSISVTSPLTDSSGLYYYSGGVNNTDPALSIGGVRGATIPDNTLSSIFGPIPGSVAQNGGVLYAVVYVRNTHTTTPDPATKLYVEQQPSDSGGSPVTGLHIDVAVPAEAINVDVPTLASQTTAPSGPTFSRPTNFASGLAFGDLPAGARRGIYLRLTVDPSTPFESAGATFIVTVESQTA